MLIVSNFLFVDSKILSMQSTLPPETKKEIQLCKSAIDRANIFQISSLDNNLSSKKEETLTALHEAAHVFVARRLGIDLESTSILKICTIYRGKTVPAKNIKKETNPDFINKIKFMLAGYVAEKSFFANGYVSKGISLDLEHVYFFTSALYDPNDSLYDLKVVGAVKALIKETEEIVLNDLALKEKSFIKRIANALLKYKFLNTWQIDRILLGRSISNWNICNWAICRSNWFGNRGIVRLFNSIFPFKRTL
ncbi:hypothetical protein K9L05_01785 [Candidatus Babeliales bacterium]|nr:hypothetical protein [Candidatus Babeliales bacterium]